MHAFANLFEIISQRPEIFKVGRNIFPSNVMHGQIFKPPMGTHHVIEANWSTFESVFLVQIRQFRREMVNSIAALTPPVD